MKKLAKTAIYIPICLSLLSTVQAGMLSKVGEYFTDTFDDGAAEISAYDPSSKRLFVVNGGNKSIDVLDLSSIKNPVKISSISMSNYNTKGANSVAVHNGTVAVAMERSLKQDNGLVGLWNASDLSFIDTLTAGALPDMVTFTPDGQKIIIANEGEPNNAYDNDPDGSITIVNISNGVENAITKQIGFTHYNGKKDSLNNIGVRISAPTATVSQDLEPEYITVSADGKKAYITLQENNAVAVLDLTLDSIVDLHPLGKKDFSKENMGLDPIDDKEINITNYPLKGLYMPDAITSMEFGGKTFYMTANEGDGREYLVKHDSITTKETCDANDYDWDDDTCLSESWVDEGKLKDLDIDYSSIDSNAIKDLPPKLLVIATEGDLDNDSKVEEIVMFGTRSFSIWDENGKRVWDSGDDIEQITAKAHPLHFNASNDDQELESRSRKKGPEPEGIVLGKIGQNTYAFVGLERIGGIMVYDVTIPTAPQFVEYINNRDFSIPEDSTTELTQTHLGPEGITFIEATHSPNGKNLLVVSNEVSGSIEIFEVTAPAKAKTQLFTMEKTNILETGLQYFGETDSNLSNIEIREGGYSDLLADPTEAGVFWTINDRGINVSHKPSDRNDKIFYAPNYHQKLTRFKIDGDSLRILSQVEIKGLASGNTTGLPNPIAPTGEIALLGSRDGLIDTTSIVPPDANGYDFEGIVFGKNGMMYMSDEYGPFILEIRPDSALIKKQYYPGKGLPLVLKKRRPNRGMEGLASTPSGELFGLMQSPLYNTKLAEKGSDTKNKSRLHRLLRFNPESKSIAEYAYINDTKGGNRKIKDIKIGGMTAINDSTFIVIEHGKDKDSRYWIDLFKITISELTTDITATLSNEHGLLSKDGSKTLEELAYDLKAFTQEITPVKKELLLGDLFTTTDWPHKKPEGIIILNDSTIAINNDNDYGMSDIDDDGIPHLLPEAERKNQMIYITLAASQKLDWIKIIPEELTVANLSLKTSPFAIRKEGHILKANFSEALELKIFDLQGKELFHSNKAKRHNISIKDFASIPNLIAVSLDTDGKIQNSVKFSQ